MQLIWQWVNRCGELTALKKYSFYTSKLYQIYFRMYQVQDGPIVQVDPYLLLLKLSGEKTDGIGYFKVKMYSLAKVNSFENTRTNSC